jgi:hypothetical protein
MNSLTFEARVSTGHVVPVPEDVPVGALVRIHLEPLTGDPVTDHYQPRTELGRKLIELRRASVRDGGKLLSCDELDEERRQRRGGVSELGLKLMEIRQRAIAGGMKLDSVDDILDEARAGRVESEDDRELPS